MIYICIPSHNEERTVGVLLWKIRQVLTAFPRDYELLVLDDASDDRTGEVLAPYARILPLTVLRHAERKGYAASMDELLREAVRRSEYPRRDVVLTLQADFTEEPDDIPALLKRIESGADIVTTRARIAPEHAPRKLRWMRAVMSRVVRRLEWPENVTDVLSGLRAYRVIGLRKALEERSGERLLDWHDGWAANAALLRAVKPYVRRIDEVEIELRPDRRQRDSRFDAWTTARQLLRLALGRRSGVAVPPREGGAAIVSASELAAATHEPARAAEPRRRGRGERDRGTRSERGEPARASATTARRGTRTGSAATEAPARRGARTEGERAERPPRGDRGDRGDRSDMGGRAERSEKTEQSERRERPARRARGESAERAPRERSPEERPELQAAAAAEGAAAPRSRPRPRRRKRGGAGAGAPAGAAAGESNAPDTVPGAAPPPSGGAGLVEASPDGAVEGVPGADGALEGAPGERKRRRRPPRRRGRATREAAPGLDAGADAGAEGSALETALVREDVGGSEGSDQLELVPGGAGEPEETGGATRPRRRSRRGGRGRSRGRRAAAEGAAAGEPDGLASAEPAAGPAELPLASGPESHESSAGRSEHDSDASRTTDVGRPGDADPAGAGRAWPPAQWNRGVGAGSGGGVDAAGERVAGSPTAPPPAAPPAPPALPPAGGDAPSE